MFLNKKTVERLRAGTWDIDCIHMELIQNQTNSPAYIIGQGFLRQDVGGVVRYKLYPHSTSGVGSIDEIQNYGLPGELVSPNCFFHLKAREQSGECWQAKQTVPEFNTCVVDGVTHYIVSGCAHEVEYSRSVCALASVFQLSVVFFINVSIPYNKYSKSTVGVTGEQEHSFHLNSAQFATAFGQFHISSHSSTLTVTVESAVAFPEFFETRI